MAKITGASFRWPFRFENPVKTANSSGGQSEISAGFLNTRGSWEKESGSRELIEGHDTLINVYVAHCYWRSDLESFANIDTKLIYDNKIFRMISFERVGEQRQYMSFRVVEAH